MKKIAINCSPRHNSTILPDEIADNPKLSINAKGLMWVVLINNRNEKFTSIKNILEKSKNTEAEIISAVNELQKEGYLSEVK